MSEFKADHYSINGLPTMSPTPSVSQHILPEIKFDSPTLHEDTDDIAMNLRLGKYQIIKKRGHSRVWAFFGKVQDLSTGAVIEGVIACRECLGIVRSNSLTTSNLLQHKCVRNASRDNGKLEVANNDKAVIEKRVAKFFFENSIPFAAVESKSFYDLLETVMIIGSKYTKPVNMMSLYMDSNILAREGELLKQNVLAEMHNHLTLIERIIAVIGFWSIDNDKSYFLSISIFYIQNDILEENFLGLRQIQSASLTPQLLRETINLVFFESGVTDMSKVTFVTKSHVYLDEALVGVSRFECVEDTLNQIFTESVNSSENLKLFFNNCHDLVEILKYSRLASIIKNDTPGNCRSTCDMLECLNKNWSSIEQELIDETPKINIKTLIPILFFMKKFIESITELRKPSGPSAHEIYPQYVFLLDICEPTEDDNELISELKSHLKSKISEQRLKIKIEHKVALFLFPLCKSLYNISEKEKMDIFKYIADYVQSDEKFIPDSPSPECTIPKNKALSKYARFYGPNACISENSVLREINRYIAEPLNLEEIDMLEWWSTRRETYKYLYQVFRYIMCIPATAIAVEKIQNAVMNMHAHENENNYILNELETLLILKFNGKNNSNKLY